MKILNSVYQALITNCSLVKESGGILGITLDTITHYQFDEPTNISEYHYQPNTDNLNAIILKWQKEGIEFAGMFHSHPTGITSMSANDEKYIKIIMDAIPLSPLYFPIVAPGKKVQFYKATSVKNNIVTISDEPITIIN